MKWGKIKWGKMKKDVPPIVGVVLAAIVAIALNALLRAIGRGGLGAL